MSPNVIDRVAQTRRLVRSEGYAGVTSRLLARASQWMSPAGTQRIRVAREDLLRASEIAASGWQLPAPLPAGPDDPLELAFVIVPPSAGGGGPTTLFRLVAALAEAGHQCTVYVQDRHGWSIDQHRETIRGWWPWLTADIRDAAEGIDDAHAIWATSWETAYKVLTCEGRGARFYLVQDFEPSFYCAGSEALLAEATYRFGFYGVTAGAWLAHRLRTEYAMTTAHFDFGCDLDRYRLDGTGDERTGVCMYARPSTARRAFELGVTILDLFAERHPEVDIHLFGEAVRSLPFPATQHGLLSPDELNSLYNRCIAGLSLSATNVSLVPYEMLASGCLPVVNDAPQNRIVLDNQHVIYAEPTPFDLANSLMRLVERSPEDRAAAAVAGAASVQGMTWSGAAPVAERLIREAVASGKALARGTTTPAQDTPRLAAA